MATVAPIHRAGSPPERFVEALNGLAVSIVSVDFACRCLTSALEADEHFAPAAQSLIDDAYHDGRLAAEDYEALSIALGRSLDEDVATEWSEQALEEASPASDTARPGETAPVAMRSTALHPGSVLRDRFVLQARIGSSGMSEVFKALDRRRQEAGAENPWLAIKVVTPGTQRFADALKLLQQEAALAQRLDHHHIVRVFDFDRDGDFAFITMEWLEGESLAELLTRQRYRPLTVARARQVLNEIGDALAFAHARGVTHADVKPGNVFLTREGTAKLLDFGIARSTSDEPAGAGPDARTPAYASCEVLEGDPATPQDDVYSLACVAYRMLAGRRAFGHNDALAAERAGRRPAPIRTLGPTQWAALERALQFRRTTRTPDLATFVAEFNATAPAATPDPRTGAEAEVVVSPRGSLRVPVAVAACVAALAFAAVSWLGRDSTRGDDAAAIAAAPPAAAGDPVVAQPKVVEPPAPAVAPAKIAAPVSDDSAPPPAPRRATADAQARTGKSTREKKSPREIPPSPPAATQAAAPAPPVGASLIAMNTAPVTATAKPEAPAQPDAPAAGAPALLPAAPAPAGDAALVATGPRLVPLTQLKFRRYVEPEVRSRSSDPDPAGWVEMEFTVGAKGAPRDIAIISSNPPGRYDSAALSAVKRWRFVPPEEDGSAVERRTSVRLRFKPE